MSDVMRPKLLFGVGAGVLIATIVSVIAFTIAANHGFDLVWPGAKPPAEKVHIPSVILLRIEADGMVTMNHVRFTSMAKLQSALTVLAAEKPPPKLVLELDHDRDVRFETVGRVVLAVQRSGLQLGFVGFITEPSR